MLTKTAASYIRKQKCIRRRIFPTCNLSFWELWIYCRDFSKEI